MNEVPRISERTDGTFDVTFPYHQEAIEAWKDVIAVEDRDWMPGSRSWAISDDALGTAVEVLLEYFSHVSVSFRGSDGEFILRKKEVT